MNTSIPILETERLRLRPATPADLPIWAERIFADPDVMRYLIASQVTPIERAQRMLKYFIRLWEEHGFGEWIVTGRKDGKFLGHCGLGYLPETREVEIDYALVKDCWGQGYATEAARASLRYGFKTLHLETVIGLVIPGNIASCRVLEHNGFLYQKKAFYFGEEVAYYTLHASLFDPGKSHYRVI